jgi:hypothetical protein
MSVLREQQTTRKEIAMKVKTLIELLQCCDREAEAVLNTQANYPMEHRIAGIARRDDCHAVSGQERYEDGTAPSDVILVEGAWLRYGERAAWHIAQS